MEPIAPDVGGRIRALREQRKLSLRALAKQCDLSVNAISMIERGENSPTVSSLQTLAAALGVKITAFFEAPHDYAVVLVRRAQRLGTQSGGVLMESLGIGLANQQLEPFMVTVEPGSRASDELVVHPGEEFVYCVAGEVDYHVGSQVYTLAAGDSMLFDATQPHCFTNPGAVPAQMLLVFYALAGSHLARQRHLDLHSTRAAQGDD